MSNIYSAVGLWVSALNYLLLTGEAEPLKVIDPELKTARPDIVKLYEDETGWVISQDQSPLKVSCWNRILQKRWRIRRCLRGLLV